MSVHDSALRRLKGFQLFHHQYFNVAVAAEDIDADVTAVTSQQKIDTFLTNSEVPDAQHFEEGRHDRMVK